MKPHIRIYALTLGITISSILSSGIAQQDTTHLVLDNTIVLQNIAGRLGHMAYNSKQNVIYLAALSNNTLEIVDLQNNKTIRSIKSLRQPIDVEYVPGVDIILVACLGDGLCRAFNASTFKEETSFRFDNNVSLVKYSPAQQALYIGYGEGAIALADANTLKYKTTIKLPVHPEAVAIDENAGKMYVNLTKNRAVGVIDLKSNTLINSFQLAEVSDNYPIAYDKTHKRLFIGCRKPAKLLVVDAEKGNKIAAIDIDGDANDIFFDEARKQIYVACGDGYLHIIRQEVKEVKQPIQESSSIAKQPTKTAAKSGTKSGTKTSTTTKKTAQKNQKQTTAQKPSQPQYRMVLQDNYTTITRTFTGNGARTAIFLPESGQIVVAVPAAANKDAMLLVYRVK